MLAERAHIADRAQRASVRRANGEGPGRVLADAVAERLRGRNVDPDSVEWDSWRREDGRWTLVADYRSGDNPRHAEFVFDAPGSYVVAEDDEARWLVGEQTAVKGPQPRSTPGPRRLSAVGAEGELQLGEDAIELVSDDPPAAPARDAGPTGSAMPSLPTGDADWIATQASERPAAAEPSEQTPPGQPAELGSEADEPDLSERPADAESGGGRRGTAGAEAEPPRVRAELGRDHVRRRQARVTGPGSGSRPLGDHRPPDLAIKRRMSTAVTLRNCQSSCTASEPAGPTATGRAGSATHSLHEPG